MYLNNIDFPNQILDAKAQYYCVPELKQLAYQQKKVRTPAFMLSSIALGCNGYEAHMQQILTPYGFELKPGTKIFAYRNCQNQAKPSGKRKTISVFSGVFGSVWQFSKR